MTLLTLILLTVFVSLGRWQWHRGEARQALWEQYARSDDTALIANRADFERIDRFRNARLQGSFEPTRQFLLDNLSHAGQPGYQVLTPFRITDGRLVLVNRGWVPAGGYRDRLPDISMTDAPHDITGRVDELPSGGLASGRAGPDAKDPWPKRTTFPTHDQLAASLGEPHLLRRVLLLDPETPGGYVRDWQPPGLPPERHYSYAIQWWGFAVVLLVLYFGLNLRKVS
jgi:surfeit locus 1 family protein